MNNAPPPEDHYTLTAYYYRSEQTYTFGPFTDDEAMAFIEGDPHKERHEPWQGTLLNPPALYGTGREARVD